MGVRNEVEGSRPGVAVRNCDELRRGRARFSEAEAFTIWKCFKKNVQH